MFPLALLNDFDGSVLSTDPALTLVLLHFTGADGSTTFADSAPVPYAFTNNSAQISSFEIKAGFGSSGFFNNDGSYPYRYINSSDAPDLRSINFKIECLIHPVAYFSPNCVVFGFENTVGVVFCTMYVDRDTQLLTAKVFGTTFTHQTPVSLSNTHHVMLARNGETFALFLNGIKSTTTPTVSQATIDGFQPAYRLFIARKQFGVLSDFSGYIDEFRVRAETIDLIDFTPPTAPFTY